MENLVTGKPTFSTLGGVSPMIVGSSQEYKSPENVTKIIENVTTFDVSGVEDLLKDLISAIHAKNPTVNVPAPFVTVEAPRVALPTFHVEAPEVKVEPKIEITVSTHWLFFATLFPTLAFLADIYVRMVYR